MPAVSDRTDDTGLTRALAEFVSAFPASDIPAAAYDNARRAIADVVGVAFAGRRQPVGRIILDYVADQGGRPVAGVFGGGWTSPELASLANGVFAHAMDFDDTNHPLYGHPSCSIVPAIFALADQSGATFERALAAYVIGVEVDAALGGVMMMAHSDAGFHSTGTIGTVGAAAAAARVLGLDAETTRNALAIAASRAAGLRINVGSMTKPLHAGAAASSAVQAARLAARGWDANPGTLDGPLGFCATFLGRLPSEDLDFTANLGRQWALTQPHGLAIKPFPCCGATHPAIDAAIALHGDLDGEDVERVRIGVSEKAVSLLRYERPTTPNQGRFSATYTVAAALRNGAIGIDDFSDAALADPGVRALVARCVVEVDDRHRGATQYPASVRVHTANGRTLERTVDLARGKNANPLTEAELKAKFAGCVGEGGAGLWEAIRHAAPEQSIGDLAMLLERVVLPDPRD